MTIIEETYNWANALSPRRTTTLLVLHHEAGSGSTAQEIHNYHRYHNGWSGIAYHYYVRKDGSVYRGRPENMVGGHCYGYNYCSIGVCFEGNFENEQMGDAQLEAGWELIQDILNRHPGIAVRRHKDLNSTACPGRNFPFDILTGDEEPVESEELDMDKDELLSIDGTGDEPDGFARASTEWAKAQGIFNGDGKGNFGWKQPITREAIAVVLQNFAEKFGLS